MSLVLKLLMVCLATAIGVLYVVRAGRWSRTDIHRAALMLLFVCGTAVAVVALGVDT